jgi:hypothetical protein
MEEAPRRRQAVPARTWRNLRLGHAFLHHGQVEVADVPGANFAGPTGTSARLGAGHLEEKLPGRLGSAPIVGWILSVAASTIHLGPIGAQSRALDVGPQAREDHGMGLWRPTRGRPEDRWSDSIKRLRMARSNRGNLMHLVSAAAPVRSMAGSAQFELPRYPARSRTDVHHGPIAPAPVVR